MVFTVSRPKSRLKPKMSYLGQNSHHLGLKDKCLGSYLGLGLKGLMHIPVTYTYQYLSISSFQVKEICAKYLMYHAV